MPHAHHHHHDPDVRVPTSPLVRYLTLGLLLLVALATAGGLAALWPDYGKVSEVASRTSFAVPGTVYAQGEILHLTEGCDDGRSGGGGGSGDTGADDAGGGSGAGGRSDSNSGDAGRCLLADVGIRTGADAGNVVEIPLRGGFGESGLGVGDRLELSGYPNAVPQGDSAQAEDPAQQYGAASGSAAASDGAASGSAASDASDGSDGSSSMQYEVARNYTVTGIQRHVPLLVLALIFVVVVVAVGRLRGLFALVALGISAGVLLAFVLPALVGGGPGLLIGVVASSAIMFVTLYFVHGPTMRTTAALIGTLCGILIIAGISLVSVYVTRLSGVGDEASGLLSTMASEIDFRGLLSCSILIAGLGVLNDVTITQASSVWELRAAAPEMSRREIYSRAMRIGRDHIASTVYTVFFAYAGAAISVLILLYLYDRPMLSLLSSEDIAIEIVRTLCGSIGLVLAVPITTWVATRFVPPGKETPFEGWASQSRPADALSFARGDVL